jgi:KaiC/GvpD/RAD55 family RecA-like ATPase/membrane protein YdbS with pleckstrin-like domain
VRDNIGYSDREGGDNIEKRGLSLAEIQEVPKESLILLVGPPGAGKSTFCLEVVAKSLAAKRPVIFVTSERRPAEVIELLGVRGMTEPVALNFVDAFTDTMGLGATQSSDTIHASCADLNSLSIAISKLQERTGHKGTLLVFDSLTSPYLFSGVEVVKFMRLFLSKFASEGNSVLASIDEGCGKEEDLIAMMGVAHGIIKTEMKKSLRVLNVVKHPEVAPTRIEIPIEPERIKLKLSTYSIELTKETKPYMVKPEVETSVSYGPKLMPREILATDEQPLYETRPLLWPRLIGHIMLAMLGIVIYVVAQQLELRLEADFAQTLAQSVLIVAGWAGIAALVFGLFGILWSWIRWRYTIYAITSQRILRQSGVIGKSYADCSLGRVQSVFLEMPILGRIFGFGTIRIATAGTAGIEIEWKAVKQPRTVQRVLSEAIARYRAGHTNLE